MPRDTLSPPCITFPSRAQERFFSEFQTRIPRARTGEKSFASRVPGCQGIQKKLPVAIVTLETLVQLFQHIVQRAGIPTDEKFAYIDAEHRIVGQKVGYGAPFKAV